MIAMLVLETAGQAILVVLFGLVIIPFYFFGLLPFAVTIPIALVIGVPWSFSVFLAIKEMRKNHFVFPRSFSSYLTYIFVSMYFIGFLGIAFTYPYWISDNSLPQYASLFLFVFNLCVMVFAFFKERGWRATVVASGSLLTFWTLGVFLASSQAINQAYL
jgi:membrane protease YdiL (CAAX protease family)